MIIVLVDYAWYSLTRKHFYGVISGLKDRVGLPGLVSAYAALIAGLLFYATLPALAGGSVWYALVLGALYGVVVYGIHAGAGYALMRGVPLRVAVAEFAHGVILMSLACMFAYLVGSALV